MSKLKAVDCFGFMADDVEFYRKSEADAVIRHHKYKRCLGMADACRGNFLVAEHMIEKDPKNPIWHKQHEHYGRWMMLWRCFAEEFKPEGK